MASEIFYLISLLFLLPHSIIAQRNGSVQVGETLMAGAEDSPWLSASGEFAFGFQRLENKDLFLLSIWYEKIPQKTIVWYNKGGNPASRGSRVELTADRGLVLNDLKGNEIWSSDIGPGAVASGVMNDTGNFVLTSSSSQKLWDSFSDPRDTLLPTQTMETGGMLFSRQSETNFSQGRFQLRLLGDGNLVLNPVNVPTNLAYDAYYISGTYDAANSSNSGYQVIFNESGYMYILKRNGQRSDLTIGEPVSAADFYHRAILNFDGVFAQYFYPKRFTGNGSWSQLWSQPENICVDIRGDLGSGACGFNSICSLNNDRRPTCNCPPGYSFLDKNDVYGNCKPDFVLSCNESHSFIEDFYDFATLNDIDWPTSDYELMRPYNQEECRHSCLVDCLCAVAISRGDSCWKKKLPLSNGRAYRSVNGKAFIKFRKGDAPPLARDQIPNAPPLARDQIPNTVDKNPNLDIKKQAILTGLLGTSGVVNVVLICAFCVGFFFNYKKKFTRVITSESTIETNLRCFTYKELAEATNNFKEAVGRGSFGIVYKGVIQTSSTNNIAVKKLDRIFQDGEKEFKNEVIVIGQTHHKNLVRLLGFCHEGQHRLLVYEFFSNGTLADFLFGNSRPSWNLRTQIAYGISRGLLYLHEECSTQIIHCDIKPQNILLDEYYNARISDFGLAKLLMMNQSQTKTAIRGTKGYVAAEWYRSLPITSKVDVYSFGVMLLEIISCRRSFDVEKGEEDSAVLTYFAYDCYRTGKLDILVENDIEAMNDIERLEKFVMIAIWCIQEDPSLRPTMRKVSQMLEGVVEVSLPPNPSPFCGSIDDISS